MKQHGVLAMDETIRIADQWYVLATSSRADEPARVLKQGECFALFNPLGDIDPIGAGEAGLYYQGTRFLSRLELRLNGRRPMLLNSYVKEDNSLLTVDLTTPDCREGETVTVQKGTVHVFRAILLEEAGCRQHIRIVNYNPHPVDIELSLQFGADYADIFEVRGFKRARRGQEMEPRRRDDGVLLGYRGLDGVTRHTLLASSPPPSHVGGDLVRWRAKLGPKLRSELDVVITCGVESVRESTMDYGQALANAESAARRARGRSAAVETSNGLFNTWIERSAADLAMLATEQPEGPYPYAGVPWFSTPFGRDGIITALECLWTDPALARGVLGFLADTQATSFNAEQDAEPGKILHEMRSGELAALNEIPFGRYYGSVDSTPLFVALAGAYYERTGDLDFIRGIWPSIERALEWIDRHGDCDDDGFVDYQRRSARGLTQQGWKDSEDSVFHHDGRIPDGPIALAEVQGYVYRAKRSAAHVADALKDHARAKSLRSQARTLRERFEQVFWCGDLGTYALAIDGAKQPCRVRSSNAGQVLWSGIASPARAARTAHTLFTSESFSGWGVRTIAEGEARYNPMSYHNGSVWPHDNALIGIGLARYGMKDRAMAIMSAMFDASASMDLHRVPELFCGFVRRSSEGPTLYPVACSPQAWASGSVFYLLQACLGLSFRADPPAVHFAHPQLPDYLERVDIRNLRVGASVIDLSLHRHTRDVGVNVLRKEGNVEISVQL